MSYVKSFTFLDREAIRALEAAHRLAPERREAQRVLASEVTTAVHGAEQTLRAEQASSVLFSEDITKLAVEDALAVFDDVPSRGMARADFEGAGVGIVDLVRRIELAPSSSEARRLVQSGGIYVNNVRVADPAAKITVDQAIGGELFVVRKGQKQNFLVRLI